MHSLRLATCALMLLFLGGLVDAEAPKSPAAKKAADAYQAETAKLEDAYRKDLKQITDKYLKDLDQARKVALEKNDLDEAQRILEVKKSLAEEPKQELVTQRRRRLADTTWEWLGPGGPNEKLTLNADGSVTASWMKNDTGRWYVNPDLTVMWWSTGHGVATIMKFNSAITEHTSSVPKTDLPRWGKKVR